MTNLLLQFALNHPYISLFGVWAAGKTIRSVFWDLANPNGRLKDDIRDLKIENSELKNKIEKYEEREKNKEQKIIIHDDELTASFEDQYELKTVLSKVRSQIDIHGFISINQLNYFLGYDITGSHPDYDLLNKDNFGWGIKEKGNIRGYYTPNHFYDMYKLVLPAPVRLDPETENEEEGTKNEETII